MRKLVSVGFLFHGSQVVPDKGPLNARVCVCVCVCVRARERFGTSTRSVGDPEQNRLSGGSS